MRLRLILAVWTGKIVAFLSRLLGGRGSSLPGVIALKLYPAALHALARQVREKSIIVTGTNGKTTTNNLLAAALKTEGHTVICNLEGANLVTGVTTAFIRKSDLLGRVKADYAVLEVDEASFPRVASAVRPGMVVITNFFRDQLDRYGELDKTVSFIREALEKLPAGRLVLNADDPLVAQLGASGWNVAYYGLEPHERREEVNVACRESRFCPLCGSELRYSCYHYSQLGQYHCTSCSFTRPKPDVEAREVRSRHKEIACRVTWRDESVTLRLSVGGFYNLYNALASFTAGKWLGLMTASLQQSFASFKPATGRLQAFWYRDKQVYLNLVKNPTGFNESISLILETEGIKDLFIAINDNAADGRDISWLWDVDFEALALRAAGLKQVICSGKRAAEMAVRLKYAGMPTSKLKVIPRMAQAVDETLKGQGKTAYFLATYTALWPVEKILRTRVTGEVTGGKTAYLSSLS
ncbi:MAG: DUF1727 domain-containing protein [Peptococcaceae bacterium]|nr:DUF1727 domain-containing protein [Peptococcaceae bacterium]